MRIHNILISVMLVGLFIRVAHADLCHVEDIDVYRTSPIRAERILENYRHKIKVLSCLMQTDNSQAVRLRDEVIAGIKTIGPFVYVDIVPIQYSDGSIYVTIDLVENKDASRLDYFLPEPTESIEEADFLINQWIEYHKKGSHIFKTKTNELDLTNCPFYHCIFGFKHPELSSYASLFESQAEIQKKVLVNVLRKDKHSAKRSAAAYLLGHLKDGDEIILLLKEHMYDSSQFVRNSVMRVIASTIRHQKVASFPIKEVSYALDFPSVTDRNKALYILTGLAENDSFSKIIMEHAANQLVNQLQMKQPNIRKPAYEILRKISNEDYGDSDFSAWQRWCEYSMASLSRP